MFAKISPSFDGFIFPQFRRVFSPRSETAVAEIRHMADLQKFCVRAGHGGAKIFRPMAMPRLVAEFAMAIYIPAGDRPNNNPTTDQPTNLDS